MLPEPRDKEGFLRDAANPQRFLCKKGAKGTNAFMLLSSLRSVSCQHSPLGETSASRTREGEEAFHADHTGQIILRYRAGWRWKK